MSIAAPKTLSLSRGRWDRVNPQTRFSTQEELDAWLSTIDNETAAYRQAPKTLAEQNQLNQEADARWNLSPGGLGDFQSKYNEFEEVPGRPGVYRAVLQQPGANKYDLVEAFYKLDPATGQASLIGDAKPFKQKSSWKQFQEEGLPVALSLVGGAFAPAISALHGVGGAAGSALTGGIIGGGVPLLSGQNTENILKGAVLGGVGGYAGHELFGPAGGPSGGLSDADFEALYGPMPDAPSMASLQANGVGGLGSLPVGDVPQIVTTGTGIGAAAPLAATAPALGTALATQVNPGGPSPDQVTQIEVQGQQNNSQPTTLPTIPPSVLPSSPSPSDPMLRNDDMVPVEEEPGVAKKPGLGSKFMDWAKKNPLQALQLLGGLGSLAGIGGGGGSGGGSSVGSQAGLTAQQAPKFQRTYVPPPPGYRPGFDPEHRYFTGIGTVGTGG